MRCPKCGSLETRVIETRTADEGRVVRRRRECPDCTARFTTYEKAELRRALRVIKKDGRREGFDRDKMIRGMNKACEKLPVTLEQMEKLLHDLGGVSKDVTIVIRSDENTPLRYITAAMDLCRKNGLNKTRLQSR